MENLITQINHLLQEQCRQPAPPMPFPAFTLQPVYGAGSWCAGYLQDPDVAHQDVTARCAWDLAQQTLLLPADVLKSSGACCVYGLALLDEGRLAELCATEGYVCLDGELTLSIRRTPLFCNWDRLLGELLLTGAPFFPPPGFEARKMIRLDFQAAPTFRRSGRLSLDLRRVHPVFETAFFFPGYLIPDVEIQEGQIPRVRFVDHQHYQHTFTGLNRTNTLFIIATPEAGDPFIIYPHAIDAFCDRSDLRLRSYSIVSRPPGPAAEADGASALLAHYSDIQQGVNHTAAFLPELQHLRHLAVNIQPAATILDRYQTVVPSRGDLHHLLTRLPLALTLELEIQDITLQSVDVTTPAFAALSHPNPLTDYAWFLHPSNTPWVLPETSCQMGLIVLTFQCRQHLLDIFYINLLDYVCTFLNQHIWNGCRVVSRERLNYMTSSAG